MNFIHSKARALLCLLKNILKVVCHALRMRGEHYGIPVSALYCRGAACSHRPIRLQKSASVMISSKQDAKAVTYTTFNHTLCSVLYMYMYMCMYTVYIHMYMYMCTYTVYIHTYTCTCISYKPYSLPLSPAFSLPPPCLHPSLPQELAGVSDELSLPPEESSSPEQCMAKLTALIRVFTSVLSAVGTSFSPSRSADVTADYIQEVGTWHLLVYIRVCVT